MNRATPFSAPVIITGVLSGGFFLGLFVTGGLLSIGKPMPAFVQKLHYIMPYLAALSSGVTLYLLLSREM